MYEVMIIDYYEMGVVETWLGNSEKNKMGMIRQLFCRFFSFFFLVEIKIKIKKNSQKNVMFFFWSRLYFKCFSYIVTNEIRYLEMFPL